LIGSLKSEEVEALIEKEIKRNGQVREELNGIVLRMEEVLSRTVLTHPITVDVSILPLQSQSPPAANPPNNVKAKLT